jgi:hypothetical protein
MIILASTISLADLSTSLCLVFAGRCMIGFDLPANYYSDTESLIRKSRSWFSLPGSSGSHVWDIVDKFQGSPTPQEPTQMAGRKCINDFSAPFSSNVRTGPETNVGDGSFELVIPRSEKTETRPPYVCPGCSNHTYNNNMINRCHAR